MEKRVIKFRAWDTVMKWYVPDFDNWIDFHGNYYSKPDIGFDTPHIEIVKQYHYEIEQFTGLRDKNGKEIYEGDIMNDGRNLNREVYFDESGQWAVRKSVEDNDPNPLFLWTHFEVVGHIHETN